MDIVLLLVKIGYIKSYDRCYRSFWLHRGLIHCIICPDWLHTACGQCKISYNLLHQLLWILYYCYDWLHKGYDHCIIHYDSLHRACGYRKIRYDLLHQFPWILYHCYNWLQKELKTLSYITILCILK